MCVFNGFFMRLGPHFIRFGHKDISCCVRNRMLDKIVFRQSHVFFKLFFHQHVHTGKCICRFAGIYAYCRYRYFVDQK